LISCNVIIHYSGEYFVEKYEVWFNTSSIDEADDKWTWNRTTSYNIEEIKNKTRHHTVTHVILRDDIPPNMNKLFPHLTHLRVKGVQRRNADWTRYTSVII